MDHIIQPRVLKFPGHEWLGRATSDLEILARVAGLCGTRFLRDHVFIIHQNWSTFHHIIRGCIKLNWKWFLQNFVSLLQILSKGIISFCQDAKSNVIIRINHEVCNQSYIWWRSYGCAKTETSFLSSSKICETASTQQYFNLSAGSIDIFWKNWYG